MMDAVYQVRINGLSNHKAVHSMKAVLETYAKDIADCFGLEVIVDTMDWGYQHAVDGRPLSVPYVPMSDESSGNETEPQNP